MLLPFSVWGTRNGGSGQVGQPWMYFYVLGVALGATGSATEAAREKDLARRLSSTYEGWDTRSPPVPRGLERVRMDLGLPDASRIENVIGAAGQRDQRQLASFHLDAGRRAQLA